MSGARLSRRGARRPARHAVARPHCVRTRNGLRWPECPNILFITANPLVVVTMLAVMTYMFATLLLPIGYRRCGCADAGRGGGRFMGGAAATIVHVSRSAAAPTAAAAVDWLRRGCADEGRGSGPTGAPAVHTAAGLPLAVAALATASMTARHASSASSTETGRASNSGGCVETLVQTCVQAYM